MTRRDFCYKASSKRCRPRGEITTKMRDTLNQWLLALRLGQRWASFLNQRYAILDPNPSNYLDSNTYTSHTPCSFPEGSSSICLPPPSSPANFSGELEDALEIALKAVGGVHRKLLELGLSCEDLGKTSVHLSVQAQEAPAEV